MSSPQRKLANEIRGFFPSPHRVVACLATVDAARDSAPETRTMTLMESDWHFYVATGTGTRKAREMRTHAKVAALAPFRNEESAGYLRISGTSEPVDDPAERKRIADCASYNLGCRWKGGAGDPNLAFFHIMPERIEYMRPGDDDATDVTSALLGAPCLGAGKANDDACRAQAADKEQDGRWTRYVIVLSRTDKPMTEALVRRHVAHLKNLDRQGRLVLCGPFQDHNGGMVIVKAGSSSEAKAIAEDDPFVREGAETYELRAWELSCEANNHMGLG